jgi:sterol desaturase/sphingolipid hydroxylase (fatty acid hydroxylase superfamily)
VHHSPHKRHWDKNFGVLFSIWDQMFGTQYRGWKEYPRTGIPNEDFPHETSRKIGALLWTPIAQMIWPFRKILSRNTSS